MKRFDCTINCDGYVIELNDLSDSHNSINENISFKTAELRSELGDGYIVVKDRIIVEGTDTAKKSK